MSSTGSRASGAAGFTLIEVMVVLAIMALALLLVPPNLIRGSDSQALKADLRQVVGGLRFARTRAIALNSTVELEIDPDARRLSVDMKPLIGKLNAGTRIALMSEEQTWRQDGTVAIRFFPDGGSSGGDMLVSNDASRYRVRVNWLTGDVTAAQE